MTTRHLPKTNPATRRFPHRISHAYFAGQWRRMEQKTSSFVKNPQAMKDNKQPIFPQYPRIAVDPRVCTGRPHIAGTRITVSAILANMAGGMDIPALLKEFPRLKEADILQALAFASSQMQDQFYPVEMAA